MNVLIQHFEKYLKETLNVSAAAYEWKDTNRLPFFLQNLYSFYQVSLLNIPFLVMAPREAENQTPAIIRKHFDQVQEKWQREIICLLPSVSAYNRKRLIEQRVPFVVPGKQMYLPMLGIDLREHFRKIRSAGTQISPSTQVVVLYALLFGVDQDYTPSNLASRLSYTVMTLTRAFNEIESAGLGKVIMKGRERLLRFGETKRDLWENAHELLHSPVKRRLWIQQPQNRQPGPAAGLTALSHFSLLTPPANPVHALSIAEWKATKQSGRLVELTIPEPQSLEIEIWSYSPHLFAENEVVDRFSLFLSLQDSEDERVESALEQMMETFAW